MFSADYGGGQCQIVLWVHKRKSIPMSNWTKLKMNYGSYIHIYIYVYIYMYINVCVLSHANNASKLIYNIHNYTSVDPKYFLSSSITIYVRAAHGEKVYRSVVKFEISGWRE